MKKLIALALFCILSVRAFALGNVVQAVLGGNASGTNSATATGSFPSNTISGNTLAVCVWLYAATSNAGDPFNVTPTTVGITWHGTGLTGTFHDSVNNEDIGLLWFFAINAPGVNSSTTTSVAGSISGGATTFRIEIALFEIGGVIGSYPSGYGVGHTQSSSSGTPSINYSTGISGTGFVLQAFAGEGSTSLTAGTGYALGPAALVVIVGQTQYAAGQPAITTAAFSGTSPFWYSAGLWFEDGVILSIVPRHKGSVF